MRDANSVLEETVACSTALTAEFSFSHCEGSSNVRVNENSTLMCFYYSLIHLTEQIQYYVCKLLVETHWPYI